MLLTARKHPERNRKYFYLLLFPEVLWLSTLKSLTVNIFFRVYVPGNHFKGLSENYAHALYIAMFEKNHPLTLGDLASLKSMSSMQYAD